MKTVLIRMTLLLAVASLGVTVYAEPRDDRGGGFTLRGQDRAAEFWNLRPNDLGNGSIELSDPDDDDNGLPDTIVWCIGGDGTSTQVLDEDERLILFQEENRIYDAAGVLQCTATREGGLFKLHAGDVDGPVILTTASRRFVFEGDVERRAPRGTKAWRKLAGEQLLYEFYGDDIYDGRRLKSDVLVTASAPVFGANPMRKLLIAALLSGACGADDPQGL